MTFGEQYKYTGSRSSATPQLIPPVLQSLMDKVNSEYCTEGQPQVNSCLINRFIGPDSSLPMHSDNELTIHPESFIHTISLGASCTVSFVTTSDDSETHTHAGLLSQHLSKDLNRYQKPDYLHLNWKGIAKLGVLIRNTVLLRMNGGNDRRSRRSRTPWNNKHPSTGEAEGYAGAAANGFSHNRDGYQSS
ncbi:hypothetical protein ACHWQZ_G001871 [Mnemiopsis leidyi]